MKKFIDESWLVLLMGIVFACLLAATQTGLADRIAANEAAALNEAIVEVVPAVASKEELKVDGNRVFKCLDEDGNLVGWAVEAAGPGFVDKITLVVGLSPGGEKLSGIKVLKHTETPGLGTKIETKGDRNQYPLQYAGKSTEQPFELVKQDPSADHEIQAITAATYSSQYVMEIVNDVIARIWPQLAAHR